MPNHTCHWPGCTRVVEPKLWGCNSHWFQLPRSLRMRIWATYKPGQEVTKTPSPAYIEAAKAVQEWIANRPPSKPRAPRAKPYPKPQETTP